MSFLSTSIARQQMPGVQGQGWGWRLLQVFVVPSCPRHQQKLFPAISHSTGQHWSQKWGSRIRHSRGPGPTVLGYNTLDMPLYLPDLRARL